MLLSAQLRPILVFDGLNLPAKADTEARRRKSKKAYKEMALQYLREGNRKAAQECFERCVDVTPEMARAVMKAARRLGVDCIVAPYESDAQLAYLAQAGYVDLVISEDSDLLMFGCKQVIFKLDLTGNGLLVTWSAGFGEKCCGIPASNFSPATLRQMGVLAGCDYFPGVPRIGLATAAKILRQYHPTEFRTLLSNLGNYFNLPEIKSWPLKNEEEPEDSQSSVSGVESHGDEDDAFTLDASYTISSSSACSLPTSRGRGGGRRCSLTRRVSVNARRSLSSVPNRLPEAMINAAVRAERTFRLQVVFDPKTRRRIRLTQPTPTDVDDERLLIEEDDNPNKSTSLFYYAGDDSLDPEIAFQMAIGNVDFYTGETVGDFVVEKFRVANILNPGWPVLSMEDAVEIRNDPHTTIIEGSEPSWPESSPYFERPPTFSLDFGYAGKAFKVHPIPRPDDRFTQTIWNPKYSLQPGSNPNTPLTIRPHPSLSSSSSSSSLDSSTSAPPLLPSHPSLPRLKTSSAYSNHRVFFPAIVSPKSSVPVKRQLADEGDGRQGDEDSRMLSESAKISKVLESYGQAAQVSPMASHGISETPVVSASAYFKSPLSAVCKAAPPSPSSPPRSPVFSQKPVNSLQRIAASSGRTVNRFAVTHTSRSAVSTDLKADPDPIVQTAPFRPPLAELPLGNQTSEAALASAGRGPADIPLKIERSNLFTGNTGPRGVLPKPCSPVYSGGDVIFDGSGVQVCKTENSHCSSLTADDCITEDVKRSLVSVNFAKWRFKSSRTTL
ncbi:Rad2 nuclease [Sparganum proliferum]